MMSQYPAERRGSSQEYMRVNQSPLHLSQEKSGVEERRTVSLPSLGGAHMRINGGMGGGTIVKGSLAHHKRNKASSIQVRGCMWVISASSSAPNYCYMYSRYIAFLSREDCPA